MVDQELDALLVGALYGELEPADEARLAAHLESHPTDRTALDDLRSTRKTLLDSRFFELHFDPPASVSALLVQEAARRAPRAAEPDEGWFMRFVRMFALHPAMAAAATLVLVVGVAGTLYMKRGADFAAPRAMDRADESAISTRAATGSSAAAPAAVDVPKTQLALEQRQQAIGGADQGMTADLDDKSVAKPFAKNDSKPVPAKTADYHSSTKGIIVAQHEAQPKDLDRPNATSAPADDLEPSFKTPAKASPPPPPAPVAAASSTTPAPPAANNGPAQVTDGLAATGGDVSGYAGNGAATGKKEDQQSPANAEDSWASNQHTRVRALVANGRCTDAAPVAAEIETRNPDYYNAYVATDRALKQCKQYIASEVEKRQATRAKVDAAKAAKVKATDSTK
jgi:hypothetical protein